MERAKGFEPSTQNSQPVQNQTSPETPSLDYTQIRAQILGELGPELAQVVAKWSWICEPLKMAILAIVNSSDMAGPAPGAAKTAAPLDAAPADSPDVSAVRTPAPDANSISSGGIRLLQSNVGYTSETTKNKRSN